MIPRAPSGRPSLPGRRRRPLRAGRPAPPPEAHVLLAGLLWAVLALVFLAVVFAVDFRHQSLTLHFTRFFYNWDAGWYRSIAQHGYSWNGNPAQQQNVAFFPGYPAVVALLGAVGLRRHLTVASFALTLGCQLVALVLLYRLYRTQGAGRTAAVRATLLVAVFPVAVYSLMGYPVSLLNLLAVLAVYAYVRGRRALSFVAAGAATACGPVGVAMPLGLAAYDLLRHDAWRERWRGLPLYALGFWGVAGYALYLWRRFGAPFVFVHDQAAWQAGSHISLGTELVRLVTLSPLWHGLSLKPAAFMPLQDDLTMIATVLLVVWLAVRDLRMRRGPRLETLLAGAGTALLIVFLAVPADAPASFTRLSYVFLPFFLLDARVRRFAAGRWFAPLSFAFVFLSSTWLLMLAHGLWVE